MSAAAMAAAAPMARHRHQVGMMAFLASAVMLFTAFTAAYIIRRTAPDWTPIALPSLLWPNTVVLVASSVTLGAARPERMRALVAATAALGLLFAAGQVLAWRQMAAAGLFLASNPHSAFFHVLTGVHAVHVLGGLGGLAFAARRPASRLAMASTYWHFMTFVWIYLLCLLTLF